MQEYSARQDSVRANMRDRSLDAVIIGDPANMNWLTGFDAWSFYVPQIMQAACETIELGVRQCDLMAKIIATQMGGNQDFAGDMTLVLAGEAASTAHPMWTDEKFVDGQTVALELGGTRKRYDAGLARTFQLGSGSQTVFDTSDAVQEGLDAVLASIKAGVVASDAHRAWQQVLDKHGLVKESRIGYSIGVGYPPDWGEHTVELSETVRITEHGAQCLTTFPRDVHFIQ